MGILKRNSDCKKIGLQTAFGEPSFNYLLTYLHVSDFMRPSGNPVKSGIPIFKCLHEQWWRTEGNRCHQPLKRLWRWVRNSLRTCCLSDVGPSYLIYSVDQTRQSFKHFVLVIGHDRYHPFPTVHLSLIITWTSGYLDF